MSIGYYKTQIKKIDSLLEYENGLLESRSKINSYKVKWSRDQIKKLEGHRKNHNNSIEYLTVEIVTLESEIIREEKNLSKLEDDLINFRFFYMKELWDKLIKHYLYDVFILGLIPYLLLFLGILPLFYNITNWVKEGFGSEKKNVSSYKSS